MKMFLTASTEHLDTVCDYYHMAPLHAAVSRGHSRTTSVLTSFGANVNALDSDKMTPLHYAAKSGHFKCAKVRAQFLSCPGPVLSQRRHEPSRVRPRTTFVRQSALLTHSRHCGLTRAQPPVVRAPGIADASGCRCEQAFGRRCGKHRLRLRGRREHQPRHPGVAGFLRGSCLIGQLVLPGAAAGPFTPRLPTNAPPLPPSAIRTTYDIF